MFEVIHQIAILLSPYSPHFQRLDGKKKEKWNLRIVSFLNAVLVSFLALFIISDPHLLNDRVFASTSLSTSISSSLSFMITRS